MGKSLGSHTVKFSLDPASLEEVAEEIMWAVRAKVARDLLFDPLLGLAEKVFLLGCHVERGFDEEDPNSPLATAVAGITYALGMLIDVVEDAKQVAEFQEETSETDSFRMKGGDLPALQPLLTLAKRLSSLGHRTTATALHGLDEEDPRAEAAQAISTGLATLVDSIEDARKVFAAYQGENEEQQVEES